MPIIGRRSLILGGAAIAAAASLPTFAREAAPVVTTGRGRIKGALDRGVSVFRGIPYGGKLSAPDRRFKAPPPAPSWTGILDATRFGAPAIQPQGGPANTSEPAPSEDCLFLNIWTPAADGAKRPVMFYSHGGGFTVGSGGRFYQDGANLAREQDVVVVASNHRLGVFGYLYLGHLLGPEYEGNQGLQDIVAALAWVHENIAAFGGDPDNVMIFGESGGGGKTACLYAMPSAAPYFGKASIESPIGPEDWSADQATDVTRQLMKALDLSDAKRLLHAPAELLLRYQTGGAAAGAPGTRSASAGGQDHRSRDFWPLIDGRILPELPFGKRAPMVSARKPLIVGGCKDEAVFFSFGDPSAFSLDEAGLRNRLGNTLGAEADDWIDAFRRSRPEATPSQLYMAIMTATPWRAHAVHIAEQKAAEAGAPVYSYILNYASPDPVPGTDYPMGSPHASDIAMKFDNAKPSAAGERPLQMGGDFSEAKQQCAHNMSTLWATFARTGRPAAPGQPEWPPYGLERRDTMLIDATCRVEQDPERDERRFWQTRPEPEQIR